MIRLTKEQVLSIHSSLIEATGGTDGVRDNGSLESALESPFRTFDGNDLYPFIDGNKRIGVHTMLVFLELNGVEIECTQTELIEIGLSLANGKMSAEKLTV